MDIGSIGLPFLLLVATFGAYSTVLKTIDMLNATRNMILGLGSSPAPIAVRHLMLRSDWIPLQIGFTFVMVLLIIVFAGAPALVREMQCADPKIAPTQVPVWVNAMTRPWRWKLSRLGFTCYSFAFFGALTVIGNTVGSVQDYYFMLRVLEEGSK